MLGGDLPLCCMAAEQLGLCVNGAAIAIVSFDHAH
jgi:hypothetical protein